MTALILVVLYTVVAGLLLVSPHGTDHLYTVCG
jgi:hypothetical protein